VALDTRSPFVIDTHELGRRPGAMREMALDITLPEPVGIEVIALPAGSTVDLQLRLESVVEGILVTGEVEGDAIGECVRCLEPVSLFVASQFQELYIYHDAPRGRRPVEAEELDDLLQTEGDLLSIEAPLRDCVILELPLKPLCSPDCAGLCPTCGVRLDDQPGHAHAEVDPRWAALSGLADQGLSQEEQSEADGAQ
jgi:uncharacterized protein